MMKRRNLWLCILLVTLLLPTVTSCLTPLKTSNGTTNECITDTTDKPIDTTTDPQESDTEPQESDSTPPPITDDDTDDATDADKLYIYSATYHSFSVREFDVTKEYGEALNAIIERNKWTPIAGAISTPPTYTLQADGRTLKFHAKHNTLEDLEKNRCIQFSQEDSTEFSKALNACGFPSVNYNYSLVTENGDRYMVFDPLLIPFSDDCFPSLDTYSFASLKERVQQIQDKTISRYYLSYIMNYFKSTDNKIQVLAPRDLRYPTFPVQVYLSAEGIMWHNESYWHEFTERPYTSTSIFGNFHYYGHSLNAQNEFLTDSLSFSETGRINSIETTEDGTEIYQITQVSNDKTINYKLIRYSLQSNDTIYYVYERYNADNTTDIPNIVNLYGMQGDHCFRFHLSHPSAPITEEFIFSFGITDEYYEELDADPPIQTPA